jgi:tryptophan-rich sensory protein
MLKKLMGIIVWILVFQTIGYFLGTISQVNSATWYQTLHKSSLTPPAIVFPIVWSILYTMIAISGWNLWQQRHQPQAKTALGFYSAQMVLNWAWSPLFFNFHLIAVSFYCIILIALLTLITIVLTKNNFKLSSIMLVPYFIWLIFASYLNGVVWMLN